MGERERERERGGKEREIQHETWHTLRNTFTLKIVLSRNDYNLIYQ